MADLHLDVARVKATALALHLQAVAAMAVLHISSWLHGSQVPAAAGMEHRPMYPNVAVRLHGGYSSGGDNTIQDPSC